MDMNAVKISLGEATAIKVDFDNLDNEVLNVLDSNEKFEHVYMDDLVIIFSGFDMNFLLSTMLMQAGINEVAYGNAIVLGVDNDIVTPLNEGQIDAVLSLVKDAKESISMMM